MKTAYYTIEEFEKIYKDLGISEADYNSCMSSHLAYRTGVQVYDDYFFTHLRLINEVLNKENTSDLALIIKKDEVYIIEIKDPSNEVRDDYNKIVAKCTGKNENVEKFLVAFFENIIEDDFEASEQAYQEITDLEEKIAADDYEDNFYHDIQELKRYLLIIKNYYGQLLDILEAIEDNYNDILEQKRIGLISNLLRKVDRLKNDNDTLIDLLGQLQSTYSAHLDNKMNSTMKLLTIITTIFMPLTLIVGWYGMNFTTMPELNWIHGYQYVIILSIVLSLAVIIIAKIKKWF